MILKPQRGWIRPVLAVAVVWSQAAVTAEIPALDCVIEPYEVVEVSSAAEGVIETIHVERNDLVEKDQVLAELEADVEKASLAFAHLNASLDTDIKLRRASFKFDERNKTRINELYVKKAIPLHHKDEADTDEAKSRWLLTKAKDDKRLAALELARARAVVKRKTVVSPIAGVVAARHKSAGEYIEDQAILTVIQLHPLWVEVIVPVELFGAIENGMSAEVFPELASSGMHTATVVSVDRVIDGASGTFDVRLELPNPDYKIPSGLKCRVEFGNQPVAQALEVAEIPTAQEAPGSAPEVSSASIDTGAPLPLVDDAIDDPAPAAVLCSAIGPLANDAQADRIAAAIGKLASRITPARQVETIIDSYLIAAPLQATEAATARIQEQIRAHGITDAALIEKGEFKGQISFGVYSGKRLAERRRRELHKLGLQVDLKPRLKQKPRIWLEVEAAEPDLSEVQRLQAVARIHPEVDLTVAPCGYPSAAAGDALALDAQ